GSSAGPAAGSRKVAPAASERSLTSTTVLDVGVARYLVSDLLHLGFIGDALEVVAGRVGPFEGGEFLGGQFDVERGDRVVDLGGGVGADERRGDDRLAVQPGQGDLGPGDAATGCDRADGVDDRAVAGGGERRVEQVRVPSVGFGAR